jgi:hypothetical protein
MFASPWEEASQIARLIVENSRISIIHSIVGRTEPSGYLVRLFI